jgi:predicted Rossmann-fold nucleotide-binding protein
MPWFPVVLIGKDYWKGLLLQMQDMEKGQTISPDDINLVLITDDMEEALAYVQEKVALMPRKKERFKKLWFLGE